MCLITAMLPDILSCRYHHSLSCTSSAVWVIRTALSSSVYFSKNLKLHRLPQPHKNLVVRYCIILNLVLFTDSEVQTDSMEERDPEHFEMKMKVSAGGRFLTMHKRRKKRLLTRCLYSNQALLDDLMMGQVQVSTCTHDAPRGLCGRLRTVLTCLGRYRSLFANQQVHKICVLCTSSCSYHS